MAFETAEELPKKSLSAKHEAGIGLLLSLALLIPCFWHRHIQAGDLASHVYNAWLSQLVEQGRAPGVYLVWQWKNVLFDLLLLRLVTLFGFGVGERIAVSLCVLVFFWGVFTLASVAARRRPWFLLPGLAMLSYGYVFHMGFMNYYLSVGLASFGLAALWNAGRRGIGIAILLAPVTLLAHPLGFLWLLAAGAYRLLWPRMRGWMEWLPPAGAIAIGLMVRGVLLRHPEWYADWPDGPFLQWNGADQFWIFRPQTRYVEMAVVAFALLASALDFLPRRKEPIAWKKRRLFPEFYAVAILLTSLLPENLRPDPNAGWIGLLVSRLTLISAIFAFAWLATLRPRAWHLAFLAACAAVFFIFIYRDTAIAERMEQNAERITRELPFGTRVLSSIHEPDGFRVGTFHVVDRACIGRCFLFSNYEPSTRQFRVRVREGSPVVVASDDDSEDMQFGSYEVLEDDLPLKQIYQCDPADWTRLCIRDLQAGERNAGGASWPK